MSIRFPPPMRWGICNPLFWLLFWPFIFLNGGPARVVPTTGGEHLSIRSRAVTGSPFFTPKANFNSPNRRFISCSDCGLVQGYWVDGWCFRLDPIFRSMHSHRCRNWFGKLRVRCTENCLRSPKLTDSWQPSGRPTTYNASHYSHWG